jgi:hypothetical protein
MEDIKECNYKGAGKGRKEKFNYIMDGLFWVLVTVE